MRAGRFIAAAVAALLGAVIVYQSSQIRATEEEMLSIVVAGQDLPARTVLASTHVRLASVPRYTVPANAVTRLEEVTGRVLRDAVFAGEILNERRLTRGAELSASLLIPSDKPYAFNLPVGFFVAAPPTLQLHDRIDLIAYRRGTPVTDQGAVLVSDLQVIDLPSRIGTGTGTAGNATDAAFLTVGASAADIVKILAAREGYLLGIALRPFAAPQATR